MLYITIFATSLLVLLVLRHVVLLIQFWINLMAQWEAASKFPGGNDRGHWFWGSLIEFKKRGMAEVTQSFQDMAINGVRVFVHWRSRLQPIFSVYHPDDVRAILITAEPKSTRFNSAYTVVKPWLGDGLLVSHGDKWKRNRRLLTPAFHFKVLKSYFSIYNDASRQFMDLIRTSHKTQEYVDTPSLSAMFTLDVILRCAFSYEGDIQKRGDSHPYATAVRRLMKLSVDRIMSVKPEFIYWLTPAGREFRKLLDFVHSFSQGVIDRRREQLKMNKNSANKKHLDFLDILLTARDSDGHGLSNEDIRAEVDTFLFEGHDTTASLTMFTLYALAKHPDMQQKVRDEVTSVLGGREDVQLDDLANFTYTNMFIKETMRMYTPVVSVSRNLTQPLVLDGVTLPKNSHITIPIVHIHYHGDFWDNPKEFRPERFNDQNWAGRHPYMFVPFSAGPRNCIGQNLAIHEEKVLLSHIVRNFEICLKPDHELVIHPILVNRSATGIPLKFSPLVGS